MKNEVIKVSNLAIGYGDKTILKDINFSVYEGEILFIMGGSGTGKTTLLKSLIGLVKPQVGEIIINNKNILEVSSNEKREILRTIGVTFQEGALFSSLSIGENISLLLEEYTALGKSEIKKTVTHRLSLVGLEDFVDYYPSEISGGMKKRASLARALALYPKILFFDEPSAGLDPITSAELDRLILKLGKELDITIVVVSHELDSAYAIADRLIILGKENKGIAEINKPKDIFYTTKNEWVKKFLTRDGLTRKLI